MKTWRAYSARGVISRYFKGKLEFAVVTLPNCLLHEVLHFFEVLVDSLRVAGIINFLIIFFFLLKCKVNLHQLLHFAWISFVMMLFTIIELNVYICRTPSPLLKSYFTSLPPMGVHLLNPHPPVFERAVLFGIHFLFYCFFRQTNYCGHNRLNKNKVLNTPEHKKCILF